MDDQARPRRRSAGLVQKMHSSDFSPLMYSSLQGAQSRSRAKAGASYRSRSDCGFVRTHAYNARPHSSLHPEGWRDWPFEAPATIPSEPLVARKRCQFQQAPCQSLGDVGEGSSSDETSATPGQRFFISKETKMPAKALKCKECQATYELDAQLRVRAVLRAAGGQPTTTPRSATRPSCAARSRPGRPRSGATRTSCPSRAARRRRSTPGLTPLIRSERLAERLGVGEVYVKNDAANPTHSFKDRVVSVAVAKARELGYEVVACASTGNLANAVAAHAAAAGLDSYVFVPADLEEQKILATGIYGTQLVAVQRQLRRREPALHRALGRASLGVREREPPPLLRRGLEDARPSRSRSSSASSCRTGSCARSPRGRCSRRSPRGFEEWIELGPPRGRAAGVQRRPGRRLRAGRPGVRGRAGRLPAGAARRRSPSRLRSGTPPTASFALDLARRTGGSIDVGHRRGDRRRHPAARRDDRHLHRDRRRRHDRGAAQARRARRHRPGRARRARDHRRGPEDARRRARRRRRCTRSSRPGKLRRRRCWPPGGAGQPDDGGDGQDPDPAAQPDRGTRPRRRSRAPPWARRSTRSTSATTACATASPRTASCAAS